MTISPFFAPPGGRFEFLHRQWRPRMVDVLGPDGVRTLDVPRAIRAVAAARGNDGHERRRGANAAVFANRVVMRIPNRQYLRASHRELQYGDGALQAPAHVRNPYDSHTSNASTSICPPLPPCTVGESGSAHGMVDTGNMNVYGQADRQGRAA